MAKITLEQIINFTQFGNKTLDKLGEGNKLVRAITEVSKQTNEIMRKFMDEKNAFFKSEVWAKHLNIALVDKETGAVLTSEPGSKWEFLFDKENYEKAVQIEKEAEDKYREIYKEKIKEEYDIDPAFIDLTGEEIEEMELCEGCLKAFSGLVIDK